jgi:hypothetical protein
VVALLSIWGPRLPRVRVSAIVVIFLLSARYSGTHCLYPDTVQALLESKSRIEEVSNRAIHRWNGSQVPRVVVEVRWMVVTSMSEDRVGGCEWHRGCARLLEGTTQRHHVAVEYRTEW